MADMLLCPKCGIEIEVSAVLSAQLRDNLRKEFEIEARQKEREIAKREENLRAQERHLGTSRQALEQEIQARVSQQQKRILKAATLQAKESLAVEIQDLTAQLTDSKSKLEEAQAAELRCYSSWSMKQSGEPGMLSPIPTAQRGLHRPAADEDLILLRGLAKTAAILAWQMPLQKMVAAAHPCFVQRCSRG